MDYFSRLPNEILSLVFTIDNFNDRDWRSDTFSTLARKRGRQTDYSISLVSKQWNKFGNELLYSTIVIYNRFQFPIILDDDFKFRNRLVEVPRLSDLVRSLTLDSSNPSNMLTSEALIVEGLMSSRNSEVLSLPDWHKNQHALVRSCKNLKEIKLRGRTGINPMYFRQHLSCLTNDIKVIEWNMSLQSSQYDWEVEFPFDQIVIYLNSFTHLQHLSILNACEINKPINEDDDIESTISPALTRMPQLNLKSFTFSTTPIWIHEILKLVNQTLLSELNHYGELEPTFSRFLLSSNFVNLRHFRISLGDMSIQFEKKSRKAFLDLLEFLPTLNSLLSIEIRSARPYSTEVLSYLLDILPMSVRVIRISAFEETTKESRDCRFRFYNKRKALGRRIEIYINKTETPSDPPSLDVIWVPLINLFEARIENEFLARQSSERELIANRSVQA